MECAMNDQTAALDQAGEDLLSYTVSDEALEAAAGRERRAFLSFTIDYHGWGQPCC
jgi:hypothetical protein